MKKVIYILISVIGALLLSSSACEEIINPQDDGLLIDKTVSPSTTETILSKGNDIQIIIPGGALSEDATFKVEKNTKPPAMTIDKMILGNNTYKIKISGQSSFNAPIRVVINYSQSKLDDNNLTVDDIRGLIHTNGSWAEATYTLDATNKKIIISINSPSGKAKQNSDIPLTDGEITIGDGYTTIDSGDDDNLLKGMKNILLILTHSSNVKRGFYNNYTENDVQKIADIIWSGNNFSMNMDSHPGHTHATSGLLMSHHKVFKLSGSSPATGYNKILNLNVTEAMIFDYLDSAWLDSVRTSFTLKEIPLVFTSEGKDTLIYKLSDASNSTNLTNYFFEYGGWGFPDYEEFHYLFYKSDIEEISITFFK
jgi:hypothetical protein